MQWGLALNPNQKRIKILLFFCFFFLSFERKVPFLVLRKKKRGHTKSSITTSSSSYTRTEYYTYIIFIKADILLSISFPASAILRRRRRRLVVVSRNVRATTREEKRETKKRSIISLSLRRNNQISNKSEDFCTRIVLFCGERKKKDEHSNRGYSRANLERVFHPPGLEFQQQQR